MSKKDAEQHLERASEWFVAAESDDSKGVAYEKAADEVLAAMEADPGLTREQAGRRLTPPRDHRYVSKVLNWRSLPEATRPATPFSGQEGQNEAKRRSEERKVPTRHEDRVEMATKLMSDPEVVSGVLATPARARSEILGAVYEDRREERERTRERNRETAERSAPPLSALMASMVLKIDEWARTLSSMKDIIDEELPESRGRELVIRSTTSLRDAAQGWLDVLEPSKPDLWVIEGEVSRDRRERLEVEAG